MTQETIDLQLILQGDLHLGEFLVKEFTSYKIDPDKELTQHPRGVFLVKAHSKINTSIKLDTSTQCRTILIDRNGYIKGMYLAPMQKMIFMKEENKLMVPNAGKLVVTTTQMVREPYLLILPQDNDKLDKINIRVNLNEFNKEKIG